MKVFVATCFAIVLFTSGPRAEIEKRAEICETGICLYWWPKLPPLKGWHQDGGASERYGVNALAPDGSSFANAGAVIYAKAEYKPRMPETDSLDKVIANDQKTFRSEFPAIVIVETDGLSTADGKKMRTFTFFPKSTGEWEEVSYGEEGEFYLIFTLSAHSREAFDKTLSVYRDLVGRYKERL
jgi:hypothetical protein